MAEKPARRNVVKRESREISIIVASYFSLGNSSRAAAFWDHCPTLISASVPSPSAICTAMAEQGRCTLGNIGMLNVAVYIGPQ
jgi:hypothetical protein